MARQSGQRNRGAAGARRRRFPRNSMLVRGFQRPRCSFASPIQTGGPGGGPGLAQPGRNWHSPHLPGQPVLGPPCRAGDSRHSGRAVGHTTAGRSARIAVDLPDTAVATPLGPHLRSFCPPRSGTPRWCPAGDLASGTRVAASGSGSSSKTRTRLGVVSGECRSGRGVRAHASEQTVSGTPDHNPRRSPGQRYGRGGVPRRGLDRTGPFVRGHLSEFHQEDSQ